jgi:hypothetical protein
MKECEQKDLLTSEKLRLNLLLHFNRIASYYCGYKDAYPNFSEGIIFCVKGLEQILNFNSTNSAKHKNYQEFVAYIRFLSEKHLDLEKLINLANKMFEEPDSEKKASIFIDEGFCNDVNIPIDQIRKEFEEEYVLQLRIFINELEKRISTAISDNVVIKYFKFTFPKIKEKVKTFIDLLWEELVNDTIIGPPFEIIFYDDPRGCITINTEKLRFNFSI